MTRATPPLLLPVVCGWFAGLLVEAPASLPLLGSCAGTLALAVFGGGLAVAVTVDVGVHRRGLLAPTEPPLWVRRALLPLAGGLLSWPFFATAASLGLRLTGFWKLAGDRSVLLSVGGVAAVTVVMGFVRLGRRATPEPRRPWPWRAVAGGLIAVAGVHLRAITCFDSYHLGPVLPLFGSLLLGVPLLLVAAARWPFAPAPEQRWWRNGIGVVAVLQLAWVSAFGLFAVFALHYPMLEYQRRHSALGDGQFDGWFGLLPYHAMGTFPGFAYDGPWFVLEQCNYAFASTDSACFSHAAGAGLYWLPEGSKRPMVNQSVDMPMFGGWRFYVDD